MTGQADGHAGQSRTKSDISSAGVSDTKPDMVGQNRTSTPLQSVPDRTLGGLPPLGGIPVSGRRCPDVRLSCPCPVMGGLSQISLQAETSRLRVPTTAGPPEGPATGTVRQ
jgi:hypothetical protein